MISIIVCSINNELLQNLKSNIEINIGCEFELLSLDNRILKQGISHVYNKLAKEAKGEYLCFIHEDVEIATKNWGNILSKKASDENVGVIGFAGSSYVDRFPYWYNKGALHYNLKQRTIDGTVKYDFVPSSKSNNFEKVMVLDGMFLFCHNRVWLKNGFDEVIFDDFHLYDIDFTFSASGYFENYVCNNVDLIHYSLGTVRESYYEMLIRFYKKWK